MSPTRLHVGRSNIQGFTCHADVTLVYKWRSCYRYLRCWPAKLTSMHAQAQALGDPHLYNVEVQALQCHEQGP